MLSSMFGTRNTDMNCTQSLPLQSLQSSKNNTKQEITLKLRRNDGGCVITQLEHLTKLEAGEERQEGKAYLKETA